MSINMNETKKKPCGCCAAGGETGEPTPKIEKEIFLAEFENSTYNEVLSAFEAGKLVLCHYGGAVYTLNSGDGDLEFYCHFGDFVMTLVLYDDDVWEALSPLELATMWELTSLTDRVKALEQLSGMKNQ